MNLLSILSAIKNGNGEQVYQQMLESNPQFKKFVDENKGLTQEQMARKYGINIDDITRLLK